MPDLDLTDLLTDPDLSDRFSVIRRTQVVTEQGLDGPTTVTYPGIAGVVFPSGENSLVREEGAQYQGKGLTVITKFRLRGATAQAGVSYAPDVVVWHGDNFLVQSVEDYSAFGRGFVQATCSSQDVLDLPAQPARF